MRKARQQGFTLIELSIVLVIIGLIVGGVLVGQDLIKSAQIRGTMSDIEKYKTAVNTFYGKYDCLPGDCANATSFLVGTANGNGDGVIGENIPDEFFGSMENMLFWQHLALANLVAGSYVTAPAGGQYKPDINYPSTKLGGGIAALNMDIYDAGGAVGYGYVFPAQYGNMFMLGAPWIDTSSNVPLQPALSGTTAFAVDTKFDDGLPASGHIVTWQNQSGYSGGCASTNVAATAQYTQTSAITCSLLFTSAF